MLKVNHQSSDRAEKGQLPVLFRRRKCGEHDDLSSERSGKYLRYVTMLWFQDDLGVIGPKFQAGRANGERL